MDSLLKKALKKGYEDPYRDIQDKAGVRVVSKYLTHVPALEEIIREHFIECGYENKALGLNYDQLGYPGIHFEVKLRPEEKEVSPELADKVCEIQLLTESQAHWADVSHDLVYKPSQDPPDPIKRRIYLQIALLEMFDEQVAQARAEALGLPGFQEAAMLEELEKQFYRFTAETYDHELSLLILGALKPLFSEAELNRFEALVREFVNSREGDFDHLYRVQAENSNRSPLLFQPETMAIFMCLERNYSSLREAWETILPLDELLVLADVWAVDIGIVD
jgi:ppGpp synthetase/RelA/SpoT-type nucleotidyltranferase